jgi:outer membrane protein assembly factor BamA
VKYQIHPKTQYAVNQFRVDILDDGIDSVLRADTSFHIGLHEGMKFDLNVLDNERGRINTYLSNRGYYRFNKDFIRFEADTTVGRNLVDLTMFLQRYRTSSRLQQQPHRQYRIGDVHYSYEMAEVGRNHVRPKVITSSIDIKKGTFYREQDVQDTYERLMRLAAIQSVQIRFEESQQDSNLLHTHISLTPSKRNSFNVQLEGTNSAGDFGAALGLSYQNRNIFRGSEQFGIKLRGAFEAIKGLSGYQDQNYIEYSAEMNLAFPDFKFPFLSQSFRHAVRATSEVSVMFDSQNRPEFHRRVVTAAWRYKWSQFGRRLQHRIDLLDLNYVFMPWISDTFRKLYLEDPESKNAILRYNYENLFIMKWGYNFNYSSRSLNGASSNYGTNAYNIRAGVESSGNFLYGISNLFSTARNAENQYTLFNIAYAQYFKFDFDFSKSFRFDNRNSMALHFGMGVAYPYGNSTILPYEKRYFSGGANSVRGWSVRGLGPGSFKGNDGRIDFINQTGDVKLDMNIEYRSHLFWKVDAAVFIDAGNIWTLREYAEQPGGQFKIDTFWRQIAVAYGLGIRLNFNYFILRLDAGMKAVNPAYINSREHFPLIHPRLKRDCRLHFAVGLPF